MLWLPNTLPGNAPPVSEILWVEVVSGATDDDLTVRAHRTKGKRVGASTVSEEQRASVKVQLIATKGGTCSLRVSTRILKSLFQGHRI